MINIDREVKLSGAIHSKGMMILASFFASRYAKNQPMAFSVSLVFEQSYGMVDGDSASLAELCAVLSNAVLREAAADARKVAQPVLDPAIDAAGRIEPIVAAPPGRLPGQQGDPVLDRRHRIDSEPPGCTSIHHVLAQHQVLDVGLRNNHALTAGSSRALQMSKKPSIFSLTPPIAWMAPCWLTEPVTARSWRSGSSASADSSA